MLPYIITTVLATAFLALWLWMIKKILSPLREAVRGAGKQVDLHWKLSMWARGEPGCRQQANQMYQASLAIYEESAKKYNTALKRPFVRPVAWLVGFHPVSARVIDFLEFCPQTV